MLVHLIRFSGLPAAVFALGTVAPYVTAAPIVLDDFEVGGIDLPGSTLTASGSAAGAEQSGLAPDRVIGGVRRISLSPNSGTEQLDAHLAAGAESDDGITYTFDQSTRGAADLIYDGSANSNSLSLGANLLDGGNDRFIVTLTQAPAEGRIGFVLFSGFEDEYHFQIINGPGVYTFSFDEFFATDFTSISAIWLRVIVDTAPDVDLVYRISDVRAVPEPAISVSLLAALPWLTRRRSA